MITDKIGQEIKPGAYIAYGHALGRCAGLRIGKVLALKSENKGLTWNKKPHIEYRITVRGIDDDWESKPAELNSRNGTLQFPDRILVLNPELVPQNYREMLETIPVID